MFKYLLFSFLSGHVFFPIASLLASFWIAVLWPQQLSMKYTISLLLKNTIVFFRNINSMDVLKVIRKNNNLNIHNSYWKPDLIHYFQNFLVTEYWRQVNQTHFLYRNYFSISLLRWDVFKLIKNSFIKIKKQLILTNRTLFMCKIAEKY